MILKEYKNIKFLPQCEIKNIYHISWPFGSLKQITKVRYIKRKKNPSLQKKIRQINWEISSNICGILRKLEL